MNSLPPEIDVAAFDALHDDVGQWRRVLDAIASVHGLPPVEPRHDGTVLVGVAGECVIKLYPPFLHDHFAFEAEVLAQAHGRLSVPTPRLVARGERDGWPYLWMSRLEGEPLTRSWSTLDEAAKCDTLRRVGRIAAEMHALPADAMLALAPRWDDFVQRQREQCRRRQERTGLPPHLLDQLETFIAGELPSGPHVILTGEYTPMNLMYRAGQGVCGMFDFGDGLVGPAEYDWLGPLCFLAAGDRARREAFFAGYGVGPEGAWRTRLLRMLLLHRYSNLPAQLAVDGWQQAPSFEALAEFVWP